VRVDGYELALFAQRLQRSNEVVGAAHPQGIGG
jgi:hypothetical protein